MLHQVIIVMGVSGCGKSTIGRMLSDRTGIPFFAADDFHPPANVEKMASGQPLNDTDRQPWLDILADLLAEKEQDGGAILACSALKESYRRTLGTKLTEPPRWVYLKGSQEVILARMQARKGHFMPPELLRSQFDVLEEPTEALHISIEESPEAIISAILASH